MNEELNEYYNLLKNNEWEVYRNNNGNVYSIDYKEKKSQLIKSFGLDKPSITINVPFEQYQNNLKNEITQLTYIMDAFFFKWFAKDKLLKVTLLSKPFKFYTETNSFELYNGYPIFFLHLYHYQTLIHLLTRTRYENTDMFQLEALNNDIDMLITKLSEFDTFKELESILITSINFKKRDDGLLIPLYEQFKNHDMQLIEHFNPYLVQ